MLKGSNVFSMRQHIFEVPKWGYTGNTIPSRPRDLEDLGLWFFWYSHPRFLEPTPNGDKRRVWLPFLVCLPSSQLSSSKKISPLLLRIERERETVFEAIIQSLHGLTLLLLPPVEISPSRPLISLPSSIMFALSAAVCSARKEKTVPVSPFLTQKVWEFQQLWSCRDLLLESSFISCQLKTLFFTAWCE